MKTTLLEVAGAVAFACIGACFVAPGRIDSTGSSAAALQCAAGQRAFNGACRFVCTEIQPCAGGSVCAGIGDHDAVCLEPSVTCSYLGDDSVCAGRGGYYGGGRGGSTFISYSSYSGPYGIDPLSLTDDRDAYFAPAYDPYFSSYVRNDGLGCQGDARWVPAPLAGSVACRVRHDVNRCRLVNGRDCKLVRGTTEETVLPAP